MMDLIYVFLIATIPVELILAHLTGVYVSYNRGWRTVPWPYRGYLFVGIGLKGLAFPFMIVGSSLGHTVMLGIAYAIGMMVSSTVYNCARYKHQCSLKGTQE